VIKLTFKNGLFLGRSSFGSRNVFQNSGFRFSTESKMWYTKSSKIAWGLREHADEYALRELSRNFIIYSPWAHAIPYPKELTPYPFQTQAACYALARNRSYLGMDPGTGKTPTAIMIANALLQANVIDRVLYVCPPFLMTNVSAELERWSTFDLNLARYSNDKTKPIPYAQNVVLFPDSLLSMDKRTKDIDTRIRNFLNNWLMLARGLIIIDEAHRFKNERTQRSLALYKGVLPHFARAVFMSGTPMPNSPIELYPVLSSAAPETIDFKTRFEYGLKYCGAHKTQFGWKFDGATNQGELTKNVREKFLLRIKKRDVLTELPPKTEAVVFLDANYPAKLAELEVEVLRKYSPRDLMHSQLGDEHVATYRRELGFIKTPKAAEFIRGVLEDSGESLLVFAHHKEVVESLKEELRHYEPLVIAGYVPTEERARRAELFQKSNKHRVLILNIQAGGIGFNLTKASRVIFVEYSWVPAENEQAIDRAHRIGQTENVFAQYLVYRHSLDAKMMLSVLHKQKVTGKL